MPGFASEVAASRGAQAEATPELPSGNSGVEGTESFNEGLAPKGTEVVAAAVEPVVVATKVDDSAPTKAKIRIGTREFATSEDALVYAQELEIARAQDQGFIEGVKASQKNEPEVPQKSEEEELEELFFQDPKAAFAKLRASVKKELETGLDTKVEQQQVAAAQAEARETVWEKFYQDNTDLADYQELISGEKHLGGPLLQKWWSEVSTKPLDEAMSLIADKARTALKIQKNKSATTEVLANKSATTVTPAGSTSGKVTGSAENNNDEPIDFISQVRKHGKR